MQPAARLSEGNEVLLPAGDHFLNGDVACAEGALAAGCTFFAGYPITPSTEIAERMARRLVEVGGRFLQMEDELGSIAAVLGAAWGGARAMTATSGPGFSLMMENIGLGMMTETPCVIVDIQRGGPSTGLPTLAGQGDMMQARWGSHGDYEPIALSPSSCQEMYDLTREAFEIADRLRQPVFIMADEVVGHLTERVRIPEGIQRGRPERKRPGGPPGEFKAFYAPGEDLVPPMPEVGAGYRFHVTGLTHDERGYPVTTRTDVHENLVRRLTEKVRRAEPDLRRVEMVQTGDAEVILVSYGATARSARRAVNMAREKGIRAGLVRLITVWPFPETIFRELAAGGRRFVTAEMNLGQITLEVERVTRADVTLVGHAGGALIRSESILAALEEAVR